MKKKVFVFISLVLFISAVGVFYFVFFQEKATSTIVQSFEECVAAGNATLESYPAQCKTKDGKSFTENIGNEMQMTDIIRIFSPRPNQFITNPLKITGEARGTWFFEAQSSVKLVDENNQVLGTGYITANPPMATTSGGAVPSAASISGDSTWMTTDFIPFSGEITFTSPPSAKATLILEKANPSGLPEKAEQLTIPVYVK